MVILRGPNLLGPDNRDERGAYEDVEDRVKKYMTMDDDEWEELYMKMYVDRKYPGHNNLKLMMIPTVLYAGCMSAFGFEMWAKRSNLLGSSANIAKLVAIPIFGVLTLRNLDVAADIWKYRSKYPEMYQP